MFWSWILTLQNIHFLSGKGTLTFEFTTDLCFGLAFATSFPVLMDESIFSHWVFPLTFLWRTYWHHSQYEPRNRLVSKQWFDHDINATTSFVRIKCHIQDWADLGVWTNPPSRSGCVKISRLSVFSTCCLHNLRSFFNCDEELSFLDLLHETSIFAQFRPFLIFRKFCEFVEVILQQVSLCRLWALRSGVRVGNLSRYHQRLADFTFSVIWI